MKEQNVVRLTFFAMLLAAIVIVYLAGQVNYFGLPEWLTMPIFLILGLIFGRLHTVVTDCLIEEVAE